MRQIITNLLTNAVKYTSEGTVILSLNVVSKEDGVVTLKCSVEDTGIGIKEENIPRLFEEYRRIEEDRNRKIEGTGLGINITIQLLELMDSKLEETRIQIDEAVSGFECLDMIEKKEYDIIFLDHMMPEMDGEETLKRIRTRQQGLNLETPVIMLTANALTGAKKYYLCAGFADFLSKPVIPEKLEKMVVKWLPENLVKPGEDKKAKESDKVELPEIYGMDWDYAMRYNTSISFLVSNIRQFYRDIDGEISFINDCILKLENENILKKLATRVHSLKSTSAMIGALNLSGVARLIEFAAKNNDIERIKSLHPILIEELELHKQRFEVFEVPKEELIVFDKEELISEFKQLLEYLGNKDYNSMDDKIEKLKNCRMSNDISDTFEVLSDQIFNLDVAGAKESVELILKHLL